MYIFQDTYISEIGRKVRSRREMKEIRNGERIIAQYLLTAGIKTEIKTVG